MADRDQQIRYPLASDATRFLGARRDSECVNLGLWLDRYVGWAEAAGESVPQVARSSKQYECRPDLAAQDNDETIRACLGRRQAMLQGYRARGFTVTERLGSPDWRFVAGLGRASVLETGFTTHRIYGFPYLPGTSVKGLARSFAILLADDVDGETIATRGRDPDFIAVFGDTDRAGQVLFLDALPVGPSTLEVDIMDPHVSEYYEGKEPPADYLSPVVINFLTVGHDSQFHFAVIGPGERLVYKAMGWLEHSLSLLGAGAKTTAGYGTFSVSKPPSRTVTCPSRWQDLEVGDLLEGRFVSVDSQRVVLDLGVDATGSLGLSRLDEFVRTEDHFKTIYSYLDDPTAKAIQAEGGMDEDLEDVCPWMRVRVREIDDTHSTPLIKLDFEGRLEDNERKCS
ncbi:MAG: type III-B CRISPR module RAMP protein Cmr6 [Anaerolineae bacterium]